MPIRAWAGLSIVLLFVLVAVLGPLITPSSPMDLSARNLPPFWHEQGDRSHPLGTDNLGRDVLTRLVYGARHSLLVTLGALAVGAVLGATAGFVFGRFRGPWDYIYDRLRLRFGAWLLVMFIPFSFLLVHYSGKRLALVRIASIFYCLDVAWGAYLINLVFIAFVLGVGKASLILALGLVTWDLFAKDIRNAVMRSAPSESVAQNELTQYDLPEKPSANTLRIVFRTLAALAISQAGFLILIESLRSFSGLGFDPFDATWGGMANDAWSSSVGDWWAWAIPALLIILTVLGFYMLGSWVRDHLNSNAGQYLNNPYQNLSTTYT